MTARGSSFTITGLFNDMISGPIGRAVGSLNRLTAAAANANRQMNTMGVLGNRNAFINGMNRQAAAVNNATRAINAQQAAITRLNRAHAAVRPAAGWVGGGGNRRSFTPIQQSLAALGGYGYALGRSGIGPGLAIGGGILAYSGLKKFGSFEHELTRVAKAANMNRTEMFDQGKVYQKIAQKYSIGQNDVAGLAAEIALSGIQKDAIPGITESASKALLLWDNVDPKMVGRATAKTASRWYKDKNPEELQKLMDQFVGAVDFFEDRYPTSAEDILKGYYRFMSTAKLSGMTPEQAVAQIATMTTLGEPSGERGGTRLATNWDRIAGVMTGQIKKKGMSLKGVNTKELTEDLNNNSQFAIFKFLDQLIERNVPKYIQELTKKGMDPELAKKEARKRASRDAKNFISKALGYETAKNLNPLIADYHEALLQTAVTNKDLAKWAIGNPGFIKWLESFGDTGRQIIKDLQAFVASPPEVTTITGSQVKTNIDKHKATLEAKAKETQAAWDRFLTAVGADIAPEVIAGMDSTIKSLNEISDGIEGGKGTTIGSKIRKWRLRGADNGTNYNSAFTPWKPYNAPLSKVSTNPMGPFGDAFWGTGSPVSGPIHRTETPEERARRRNANWYKDKAGFWTEKPDEPLQIPDPDGGFIGWLKRLYDGARPGTDGGFTKGLMGESPHGNVPPGLTGGLMGPQVISIPPPPITIPLAVNVVGGGAEVDINVNVKKQPTVQIQGSGANVNSGNQGDAPSGVTTGP